MGRKTRDTKSLKKIRNSFQTYRRLTEYSSYLFYLMKKVNPVYGRIFGIVPVLNPSHPSQATYLVHPHLHSWTDTEMTVIRALELLSQMQAAVHKVGMKAPGRIVVTYPYHKLVNTSTGGNGYEVSIILPHPFYYAKISGAKTVQLPLKNVNIRLKYWSQREKKLAKILAEAARKYPEVPMNSVMESIGALYVRQHVKEGRNDLIPIRSVRFNSLNDDQTEADLLILDKNNGPRVELYEVKTSDGMVDPHGACKRKLDTQQGIIRFFKDFGLPVEYHYVIVGYKDNSLEENVLAAKKVLTEHPLPADRRGVHGVLVRGRRIIPYHVEIL